MVDPAPIVPADAPRIEAVFVLDTTGSMSGLIEGAKQKIWSIANQLASAQNGPQVRLGLIGYRDRGDHYVTRRFDLSEDVDALYAQLRQFSADGGGDGPESVNQALNEAVTRISWSADQGVYRVIFLVGDAPPHMDYSNDVPYPKSVELAKAKGIVVNAIQCGSDANTARVWRSIAESGQGAFSAIAQDGGMLAMTTPMDDELGRLNTELAGTAIGYGTAADKDDLFGKMERALVGGSLRGGLAPLVSLQEGRQAQLGPRRSGGRGRERRGRARGGSDRSPPRGDAGDEPRRAARLPPAEDRRAREPAPADLRRSSSSATPTSRRRPQSSRPKASTTASTPR